MIKKILITADVHHALVEKFTQAGYECDVKLKISYKDVCLIIPNYEGLIIRSLKVDKKIINLGSKLKFIGRAGSGLELVDIAHAKAQNIAVFNSPEGNRAAVAEHTIGMMLSLLHKLRTGHNEIAQLLWDRNANSGLELSFQTIGIIGFGNVGQSLAEKLKGFGCRILVYDKYLKGFGDKAGIESVALEYLLTEATIVTLHLPLNRETVNYVDNVFLNKLKKTPILINTSRGEMINIQLIAESLDKNQISGFAADVFPKEPLNLMSEKDKSVLKMLIDRPNVLLTPHSAGLTRHSYVKLATVLAEKILNFLKF